MVFLWALLATSKVGNSALTTAKRTRLAPGLLNCPEMSRRYFARQSKGFVNPLLDANSKWEFKEQKPDASPYRTFCERRVRCDCNRIWPGRRRHIGCHHCRDPGPR